jgi:nucleotide-binding universal stress UspA family protein
MYRTIMVPLDGSKLAEWALPTALAVARRQQARIELISIDIILPTMGAAAGLSTHAVNPAAQASAYLAEVAERLGAVYAGPVRHTVRTGQPRAAGQLLQHARDCGADLIVMATHGYGPLKRLWIGSTTDAVIRRSRIPTLIIRPASEDAVELSREPTFQNILVPLDESASSELILPHSLALGEPASSTYTLFEAVLPALGFGEAFTAPTLETEVLRQRQTQARVYLEQVAAPLRSRGFHVEIAAAIELFAADAILAYAAAHDVDLITLTTHGRGFASRMLLGSVAHKIVPAAPVPVLLYRPLRH